MIEFLSEIAPATASAIAQLLPKYLDQVAFLPENHPNPRYSGMHQSSGRWSARNNGTPEGELSLNFHITIVKQHTDALIKSCFYVFKNIFIRSVLTTSSTQEARQLEGLLGGWENLTFFILTRTCQKTNPLQLFLSLFKNHRLSERPQMST